MATIRIDETWLEKHDQAIAHVSALVHRSVAQLEFKSNADFIARRGRVTLALDMLRQAEDWLLVARTPF